MDTVARDWLELERAFPFDVSDTVGVFPAFNRLHWHDSLEINYVKSGEGAYLINGTTYALREGDIVLLGPHDLHRAFDTRELVLQVTVFDPALLAPDQRYDAEVLAPFIETGIRFPNVLDRDRPELATLRAILLDIQREHEAQLPSYRTMIRGQLSRLLALINRHFSSQDTRASLDIRAKQPLVRSVLEHIHRDPTRAWTLQELAELIHLSPSRFSAIFKKLVGVPPLQYCLELRLGQAVQLLETTDRKIIDIAAECGFRNLSNFNRVFVRHVGRTPSQVRGAQ